MSSYVRKSAASIENIVVVPAICERNGDNFSIVEIDDVDGFMSFLNYSIIGVFKMFDHLTSC